MSAGAVSYKQGIVAAAKPGFCRVRFADLDGLVSAWLPVIHPKTQHDKLIWTLDVGEHVACLMDAHLEDGCIVGAVYSQADVPPVASADVFRVQFRDGGVFEYDRSSGAMQVTCRGALTVKAASVVLDTPETRCTGQLTVAGLLTYTGGLSGSGGAATLQGNLGVQGDISVQGDVTASGKVLDTGGNSNHHQH